MRRALDEEQDGSQASSSASSQPKRVRSWPHVKGLYASFVSFPLLGQATALEPLVAAAVRAPFEPFASGQLHISVTRTFPVPRALLVRFTRAMCSAIGELELDAFKVVLDLKPCLLVNDTETTTFLAFAVDDRHPGNEKLSDVSGALDRVLAKLGLPVYYEPARFHVSVAWAAGNLTSDPVRLEEQQLLVPALALKRLDFMVGEDIHSFELVAH
jgi:hypothetical protein